MRILLDTNVAVTYLRRREGTIELKRMLLQDGTIHVTSLKILGEIERVLRERLRLTRQQAKSASRLLKRYSSVVKPHTIKAIVRDPDDDYILAAALIGKADCIVTADNDLLVLGEYCGIAIIAPGEIARLLNKQEEQ